MKFFIRNVTTYRKYTKTQKGQILEKIVNGLESVLLEDINSLNQLTESINHVVYKLNCRFPKTAEWTVSRHSRYYIAIRPAGRAKSFESDYIAAITVVPVKAECDAHSLHWRIKEAYLSELNKDDEKEGKE